MYRITCLCLLAAALLGPAVDARAAEPFNAARYAWLTASSWKNAAPLITTESDATPRMAHDGSLDTGWQADIDVEDEAWLQLDFTRPWPMRYRWRSLETRWNPAPERYHWQASPDGRTWRTIATVDAPSAHDETLVSAEGAWLRVVVPTGDWRLLEVAAHAVNGASGTTPALTASAAGNLVDLQWEHGTAENVFLYRVERNEPAATENSSTTPILIAEGPMSRASDRVEAASAALPGTFAWRLKAIGPDGSVVDDESTSGPVEIGVRSPLPFAFGGMIEGYYGPLFSWPDRKRLVRETGLAGGNFYLYGPKLDSLHRARWREPYPQEFVGAFADLVATGKDYGVTVAWSLSPGLDYDADKPADREAVIAKFLAFQEIGVDWFGLFMDDIPVAPDAAAAAEQVALANAVLAALRENDPAARLLFVPTVYSGAADSFSASQTAYLTGLRALDPDIPIMWTGPDIFAAGIALEDLTPIAALTEHPLLLWDNYPVNDLVFTRRTHLGPLVDRNADLADAPEAVIGLLSNPMWQAPLNRLPVSTVHAWLRDPVGYAPETAWREAIAAEVPAELIDTVLTAVEAFRSNPLNGIDDSKATALAEAAIGAVESGKRPPADLLHHAAAYYTLETLLPHFYQVDFAGDMLPLARKMTAIGEAYLQAWHALDGRFDRDLGSTNLTAIQSDPWMVNEGLDSVLLGKMLGAAGTLAAPTVSVQASLPPKVGIGSSLRVPLPGYVEGLRIYGLPGAKLEEGVLTWKPTRTGNYRWVLVGESGGEGDAAWGSLAVIAPPAKVEDTGGCRSGSAAPALTLLFAILAARRFRSRSA